MFLLKHLAIYIFAAITGGFIWSLPLELWLKLPICIAWAILIGSRYRMLDFHQERDDEI